MGNIATITDQVKTFDDVLSIAGTTMEQLINPSDSPDEAAYKKVKLIAKVLNEGWQPKWEDSDEYKYYPWFDLSSGSGLAFLGYDHYSSYSGVGSRLCFKTRELAKYAGTQFVDIYTELFIIK
jgi:hypothetical protein